MPAFEARHLEIMRDAAQGKPRGPGYPLKRRCPCNVGDRVTCIVPVDAYYSNYGGRPECVFCPGMVGIVAHLDSPSVRPGPHGEDVFAIVDFDGPAHGKCNADTTWRVALRYGNIKIVSKRNKP